MGCSLVPAVQALTLPAYRHAIVGPHRRSAEFPFLPQRLRQREAPYWTRSGAGPLLLCSRQSVDSAARRNLLSSPAWVVDLKP